MAETSARLQEFIEEVFDGLAPFNRSKIIRPLVNAVFYGMNHFLFGFFFPVFRKQFTDCFAFNISTQRQRCRSTSSSSFDSIRTSRFCCPAISSQPLSERSDSKTWVFSSLYIQECYNKPIYILLTFSTL